MSIKLKPTFILLAVAVCVCSIFTFSSFLSSGNETSAQDGPDRSTPARPPVGDIDAARRRATAGQAAEMLRNSGISFDESSIDEGTAPAPRVFHVRLETGGDAARLEAARPAVTSLRVLSKAVPGPGEIRQQRSFELSPYQVVVFAVDRNDRVVWWETKPDPRVMRAETADSEGKLEGQTLYRPSPDMLVTVPSGREIEKIHIFSPVWDGSSFSLERLGTINAEVN